MQIPSESFEAVGYCLLSVKSIDNKYCICEIDVSDMSDSSSNMLSVSENDSSSDTHADLELDLSVSDIDFNIDISDIDILYFEKYYTEVNVLPDTIVEIHEQKNIVDTIDFHEFCCILSAVIESFVFEEASYLFYIFG